MMLLLIMMLLLFMMLLFDNEVVVIGYDVVVLSYGVVVGHVVVVVVGYDVVVVVFSSTLIKMLLCAGYEQQDAHEFFIAVLDLLHRHLIHKVSSFYHLVVTDPLDGSGSGSRRGKMTHKTRKKRKNFIFCTGRFSLLRAEKSPVA
jgi:hypothetical protein